MRITVIGEGMPGSSAATLRSTGTEAAHNETTPSPVRPLADAAPALIGRRQHRSSSLRAAGAAC